jgi:hypothetical protein
MRPFLFLGIGLAGLAGLRAEPVRFTSGPAQAALIELFSSEGCSSCPPAERWLGSLRDEPGLWRDFVPVAFHVDYWNRLGWPDRFSTRQFTAREYDYAAAWHSDSVYTPCLVRNGVESKGAREVPSPGGPAGRLTATYDGAVLQAQFSPAAPAEAGAYEIHAAILGGGIVSHVTAGENSGETLRQEFVALVLVHGAPGAEIALQRPKTAGVSRQSLAVWVTRRGELVPLQATGGWLE